jgi:hypothetical protein
MADVVITGIEVVFDEKAFHRKHERFVDDVLGRKTLDEQIAMFDNPPEGIHPFYAYGVVRTVAENYETRKVFGDLAAALGGASLGLLAGAGAAVTYNLTLPNTIGVVAVTCAASMIGIYKVLTVGKQRRAPALSEALKKKYGCLVDEVRAPGYYSRKFTTYFRQPSLRIHEEQAWIHTTPQIFPLVQVNIRDGTLQSIRYPLPIHNTEWAWERSLHGKPVVSTVIPINPRTVPEEAYRTFQQRVAPYIRLITAAPQ